VAELYIIVNALQLRKQKIKSYNIEEIAESFYHTDKKPSI